MLLFRAIKNNQPIRLKTFSSGYTQILARDHHNNVYHRGWSPGSNKQTGEHQIWYDFSYDLKLYNVFRVGRNSRGQAVNSNYTMQLVF